jgi:hypothetical protein
MDLPKDETTGVSTDKPKKLAKDRNLIAIACLTADFQDNGLLNLICVSNDSAMAIWIGKQGRRRIV